MTSRSRTPPTFTAPGPEPGTRLGSPGSDARPPTLRPLPDDSEPPPPPAAASSSPTVVREGVPSLRGANPRVARAQPGASPRRARRRARGAAGATARRTRRRARRRRRRRRPAAAADIPSNAPDTLIPCSSCAAAADAAEATPPPPTAASSPYAASLAASSDAALDPGTFGSRCRAYGLPGRHLLRNCASGSRRFSPHVKPCVLFRAALLMRLRVAGRAGATPGRRRTR